MARFDLQTELKHRAIKQTDHSQPRLLALAFFSILIAAAAFLLGVVFVSTFFKN